MEVELTPGQEAFVRQAIERGDYADSADAVRDALRLWEERERRRAEIRASLDDSEADVVAGNYRDYTDETLSDLPAEIAREARERIT